MTLTPNVAFISTSRTRPVMRDAKVIRETMEADLIRLTGGSVARGFAYF